MKSWFKVVAIGSKSRRENAIHHRYDKRMLGFDNAHAAPKASGRFSARRVEFDHWHPDGRTIKAYDFTDPGKLLEDFFAAVDQVLKGRDVT